MNYIRRKKRKKEERPKTKKEIVKMLLDMNLENDDEAELIDLLINQPIAIDVDKRDKENEKIGDRASDKITAIAGSWTFVLGFCFFIIAWIIVNYKMDNSFDPYPFILLNLFLSCIAAIQAPIIMMSQNRAAKRDTLRSENNYKTDLKSELILEELHIKIEKLVANQNKIIKYIDDKKQDEEQKNVTNIQK